MKDAGNITACLEGGGTLELPPKKSFIYQESCFGAFLTPYLKRVYGIEVQDFLLHLLEVGFLPDLRAAASLDTAALSATDMALALNRYLCTAVLPLLTRCAPLFAGTEHHASLIDSLLHTVYRLSKGCSLTKAQRDSIEVCLLSICG